VCAHEFVWIPRLTYAHELGARLSGSCLLSKRIELMPRRPVVFLPVSSSFSQTQPGADIKSQVVSVVPIPKRGEPHLFAWAYSPTLWIGRTQRPIQLYNRVWYHGATSTAVDTQNQLSLCSKHFQKLSAQSPTRSATRLQRQAGGWQCRSTSHRPPPPDGCPWRAGACGPGAAWSSFGNPSSR
jgi:hypothetical protein